MAGDYSFSATASLSLSFKVPFGSLAFMPGQLVHTNEILVLLGDNYFVERSAFQAVEIVSRRLKGELSVPSCSPGYLLPLLVLPMSSLFFCFCFIFLFWYDVNLKRRQHYFLLLTALC